MAKKQPETHLSDDIPSDNGDAAESNDRDIVNSLVRGLEVIRVFTMHRPRMTLSEVAQAAGMMRATARRFLLTLTREGYMGTDGKHFFLKPKLMELGFSALSSMDLLDVAQPVMDQLAESLQESVFLAVYDDGSAVYVARATPNRVVNVGIGIGNRVPAYCVSTGRILLADLPDDVLHDYISNATLTQITPNTVTSKVQLRDMIKEIQLQGWCSADQEFEIGLRSVSVPVKNRAGRTIAALNVCCPSARVSVKDMRGRVLPELMEAATRISRALLI